MDLELNVDGHDGDGAPVAICATPDNSNQLEYGGENFSKSKMRTCWMKKLLVNFLISVH